MGYMELMTEAENIAKLGELVDLQLRKHKSALDNVFDIEDGFIKTHWMDSCIDRIKENSESAKMLKERYLGSEIKLDELLKLPKDSLGFTYGKVMSTMGLDPHFYRDRQIENDGDYITMRVRQTHDFHHIISGFDMMVGEGATISLPVTQIGYPGYLLIELVALTLASFGLRKARADDEFAKAAEKKGSGIFFDSIVAGVSMGRKANSIFGYKFEENLEQPLEEVRKALNIVPKKDGSFSWYQDPKLKDLGLS